MFVNLNKENINKTIYEIVGEEKIRTLAKLFYEGIAKDDLLRAMYPKDLAPAEERFALFLIQFFGGPTTYSDQRGHPRLRMRHFPYAIDIEARNQWMKHITTAMEQLDLQDDVKDYMNQYFERASLHMMNR